MRTVVTLLALTACAPAHAQVQACAPNSVFVTTMADAYGETRHMFGVVSDTQVVQVFANPETGTWTIAVTSPDGTTCIASSGTDYDDSIQPLPPNG